MNHASFLSLPQCLIITEEVSNIVLLHTINSPSVAVNILGTFNE